MYDPAAMVINKGQLRYTELQNPTVHSPDKITVAAAPV
jgi:hypothetical protein